MKPQDATSFSLTNGKPTFHKIVNFKIYIWIEDSNNDGRWTQCQDKSIKLADLSPISELLEAKLFILKATKAIKRKLIKTVERTMFTGNYHNLIQQG